MTRASDIIQKGSDFDKELASFGHEVPALSAEFVAFVERVQLWLSECVQYGRYVPLGSPGRRALQGLVDYWTSRLLQLGHPLPEFDRIDTFDPTAGFPLADDLFPYHGLQAVTADRRALFYGRDDQIREYVAHLEKHECLLIQSESGGGKSSIAMAGVIPALLKEHPDWAFTGRITPGTHPSTAFRKALATALGITDKHGTADTHELFRALGSKTLLVFIDQLEELLTLCASETEQAEFSEILVQLSAAGRTKLLATLRIDHYDRLANSQACHSLFLILTANDSVKTLSPMSLDQIRRAIAKPAEDIGLRFDPDSLIDELANGTASVAGGLPLLQFALQRLWGLRRQNAKGESLDLIDKEIFKQLPTVRDALGRVAKALYEKLPPGLQKACERLMLELTVLDERLEVPLRRRRRRNKLVGVINRAGLASESEMRGLIDSLVRERLLVQTGEGESCQIEVAHEALFRHWDHFQVWINKEETRVRLQHIRQIARDAIQWEQKSRSADYLRLKGEPLKKALQYSREAWLDDIGDGYVAACDAALKAQQQEQERAHNEALEARKNEEAARAEADRIREAVRIDAAKRKKILVWSILAACIGALGIGTYAHMEATRRAAAANTFASLNIDPLEALDLAYTLEKKSPGNYDAALAHAIDRLNDVQIVGDHGQGADFTPSGYAMAQLIRANRPGDESITLSVLPIEYDGTPWPAPNLIEIEEDPEHTLSTQGKSPRGRLATLDVGPPILGKPFQRLVVVSFIYSTEPNSTTFLRLLVYRIVKGDSKVTKIGEHAYPPGTTQVSDLAFDSAQERALVAAVQLREQPPKSQLLELATDASGRLVVNQLRDPRPPSQSDDSNQGVVTAIAIAAANRGERENYITGRLDGSVFCADKSVSMPDKSPIMRLRTAGSKPTFAVLHQSNRLVVGDCRSLSAVALGENLTSPQLLTLRAIRKGTELLMSFSDVGKLCRQTWTEDNLSPEGSSEKCWVADRSVDEAIPVVDTNGEFRFLVMPDRNRAWIVNLDEGSVGEDKPDAATGLPRIWRPDYSSARETPEPAAISQVSAASPNGVHVVRINLGEKKTPTVERKNGSEWKQETRIQGNPIAATVNDKGLLVVLDADRKITLVELDGRSVGPQRLPFEGVCLAMSPNGNQVLIAGRFGEHLVINTDAPPTADQGAADSRHPAETRKGAALATCAVGNAGTAISGLQDGTVVVGAPGSPVSQLVQFRLPAGVLDVSIDAGSRYIAVLGQRTQKICLNGKAGYPIRIWDTKSAIPDYPVASGCLVNQKLLALGPLEETDSGWRLPIYAEPDATLQRIYYKCRACNSTKSGAEAASSQLLTLAKTKFKAQELPPTRIRALYGIEP